jgi:pimeloyl-ACP methyl ester carboxylesterase
MIGARFNLQSGRSLRSAPMIAPARVLATPRTDLRTQPTQSWTCTRCCTLVGHSLGGLYATLYAETYPEDIAGMVLVEPAFSGQGQVLRHDCERGPCIHPADPASRTITLDAMILGTSGAPRGRLRSSAGRSGANYVWGDGETAWTRGQSRAHGSALGRPGAIPSQLGMPRFQPQPGACYWAAAAWRMAAAIAATPLPRLLESAWISPSSFRKTGSVCAISAGVRPE